MAPSHWREVNIPSRIPPSTRPAAEGQPEVSALELAAASSALLASLQAPVGRRGLSGECRRPHLRPAFPGVSAFRQGA
ncbi:unnamed protein product [Urochloa humidicola]